MYIKQRIFVPFVWMRSHELPTPSSSYVNETLQHKQIRDGFMPVNRRWPLQELMACLHRHYPLPGAGGAGGRRKGPLALEYVMLE